MSVLHRLKAYFGMVPVDELDDYDPDYRGEYRRDGYRSGHDPAYAGGAHDSGAHEVGTYGAGAYETPSGDTGREHAYAVDRPVRRSRADLDGHRDNGHRDNFAAEPGGVGAPMASSRHTARRPTWVRDISDAPVRGSLAVDTAVAAVHEPLVPPSTSTFPAEEAHPLARIVTLHPHTYNEARPIGERYREGTPVIMNLTGMEDKDAKRLVDFAAGLAFALRGSIDKVTNKVFLLSPPNVDVSAEDRRRIAEGGLFNQNSR
ncbi:MAG: cell division protein SepF [Pseudonocardiaceae bacterium]